MSVECAVVAVCRRTLVPCVPVPQPYAHIACCVDRSDASAQALARAGALRGPGARLSVLHAAPPDAVLASGLGDWEADRDDPTGPPRRWLAELASSVPGAQPVLLTGREPVDTLAGWLEASDADLAVCSTGSRRMERLLLGSVARELVYRSPVDVLVVPPGDAGAGPAGGTFGHVACCVDESDGSDAALAAAADVARAAGAAITVVTAVSPPRPLPRRVVAESLPIPLERENRALELLERAARDAGGAQTQLLAGPPEDMVREWAASAGVDLIVVGPRARRRPGLGGFARSLAGDAPCALLFARPGGRRGQEQPAS